MLLYLAAVLLPLVNADGTYFVTASKTFSPREPYQVYITLLQPGATAEVTALIGSRVHSYYKSHPDGVTDVTDRVLVSKTETISGSGSISLMVPQVASEGKRFFELNVTGAGGVTFVNSTGISIHNKRISIFVQTDKSRYKPGDEVKYRIFATGADLRAHTGLIDVEIYDGDDNKIKQYLNKTVPTGLFSEVLPISTQPVLGVWKFKVTVDGVKMEKTFKVEEYVLPKFKVDVELPSFVVKHMESMPIKVKANYTFGKPVQGEVLLYALMEPGYGCYDPQDPSDKSRYSYLDRKPCKTKMFKSTLKDGQYVASVTSKDLKGLKMTACYSNDRHCPRYNDGLEFTAFEVVANVTDRATGEVITGRSSITVQGAAMRITFLDATPNSYKPGMDYKAWIKVERPDGTPPGPGDIKGNLKITMQYYCPYVPRIDEDSAPECVQRTSEEHEIQLKDYPDGLIQYTLPELIDEKFSSFNMEASLYDKHDDHIRAVSNTINKFDTVTEKNIQILMDTLPALKAGSTATFKVRASESVSKIYYQLLAKGKIVRQDVLESASPKDQHDLVLNLDAGLAQELSPNAKLVVVYFADAEGGKKEAIADSVSFNVDATFAYDTQVTFSKSDVKPAEQLTVNVESAQDSTVAIRAVDQSVLLLESGSDITRELVEDEVREYDPNSNYYPWMRHYRWGRRRKRSVFWGGCFPIFIGGTNIKQMMKHAGMIFMCDCIQEGRHSYARHKVYLSSAPIDDYSLGIEDSDDIDDSKAVKQQASPRVRKLFPETWLWTETNSGNGQVQIPVNAPDTITSWVLSAFAINPELGLSVSETAKTTVFQPFFARLSLPYSVVRGEQFALKITVFNYLPSGQDVSIVIDQSDKFKVIDGSSTLKNARVEKQRKVASQGTATEVIWILPEALGQVPIKVTATSAQAGDSLIRNILVKAEGAPRTYSESEFMEINSGSPTVLKFLPDIPDDAVPGSARITINVVGDLMGSAMDNLENLVKMPYGCGEQNMVNFAPNIYVLKYLEVTGQDSQAIRMKSIGYMEKGYQRELTYKRKDHSFSAFGDRDKEGSTWLTAFVMKCFSQSTDFIDVDPTVLTNSVQFLRNAQERSGEFSKIGYVHHSGLKGGSGKKGVSLSAYTTIALLELQKIVPSAKLDESINRAVAYLESQIESSKDDKYSLAIITYALSLAKSSQAGYALNQLNDLATERKGQRFWSDDKGQSQADRAPWEYYYSTPPLDVEIAAYALMSTLLHDGDAVPIVRWMTSRMNPRGGFYSTQDTVIGLEALGKFAEKMYADVSAQSVNIEVLAMNKAHTFDTITTVNAAIVQVYEAPANAAEITVTGTGEGTIVLQMTVTYNVMEEQESKDFDLKVSSDSRGNTVTVSVCMSYKGEEDSGMSIMEVNSLSGFYPDGSKNLVDKYKNKGMKTAEVDGAKMVTYWDELTNEVKCVEVEQRRADSVMKLQEQQVKVFRYYAPEVQQAANYQVPKRLQSVNICVSCLECEGCEGYEESDSASIRGTTTFVFVCLIGAFLMKL